MLEPLDPDAFDALRRTVTRANLAERDGDRNLEPDSIWDGCGIDVAAWTGDGYGHVYRTTKNGPDAVQAVDEHHLEMPPNT